MGTTSAQDEVLLEDNGKRMSLETRATGSLPTKTAEENPPRQSPGLPSMWDGAKLDKLLGKRWAKGRIQGHRCKGRRMEKPASSAAHGPLPAWQH